MIFPVGRGFDMREKNEIKKSFGKKCKRQLRYLQLYLLALIPFLFVLIFSYIPMGGILLAFKDYSITKGIWKSPWAGMKYFDQLFRIPIFPTILKNTIVLSLESMLFGFPFPIILALAFNEIRSTRLKKTLQTISFAPYFISTVVVVSIIFQMFSYRYGVINSMINMLGGESVNFTGQEEFFRPAYIASNIWQGAGYSSVLYIAALAGVDPSFYEAAAIDGAGRLQRVLHVDLPCIAPTIIITLILNAGNILSVGFEKAYLMQNPANYMVSEIIATYVYKTGIEQAQFSFSTAVGLLNSVISLILVVGSNQLSKKFAGESLF